MSLNTASLLFLLECAVCCIHDVTVLASYSAMLETEANAGAGSY